jgi:hypothetical protein
MTRAPGPAGEEPEPEGGRAAERLRQMMLERFGTETPPGPPDDDVDLSDHRSADDVDRPDERSADDVDRPDERSLDDDDDVVHSDHRSADDVRPPRGGPTG